MFRFGKKGATGAVSLLAITLTVTAALAAIARRPAPVKLAPANRDVDFATQSSIVGFYETYHLIAQTKRP